MINPGSDVNALLAPQSDIEQLSGANLSGNLLGLLKQIQETQKRPLIPQDNPLAQLGAAFQGLAAGVQGKPNPALEFASEKRRMDLANLVQQASLGLNLDSARRQAMYSRLGHNLGVTKFQKEETARETDVGLRREAGARDAEKLKLDKDLYKFRLTSSIADRYINLGERLDDPNLILQGWKMQGTLPGGLPPGATTDTLQEFVSDALRRKAAKTEIPAYALRALIAAETGTPDPEVDKVKPEFAKMAVTPEGRARLAELAHVSDTDTLKLKGYQVLRAQTETEMGQFKLAAKKRIAATPPGQPKDPVDLAFAEMNLPADSYLMMSYMQEAEGLPPAQQHPYLRRVRENDARAIKNLRLTTDIQEVVLDLKKYEKQLTSGKVTDAELNALLLRVDAITGALVNVDFADPATKAMVERNLSGLAQKAFEALEKRYQYDEIARDAEGLEVPLPARPPRRSAAPWFSAKPGIGAPLGLEQYDRQLEVNPPSRAPVAPLAPQSNIDDIARAVAKELFPDVPYIQILRSSAMIDAIRGEVRARRQQTTTKPRTP